MSWRLLRASDGTAHQVGPDDMASGLGWGTLVMEVSLTALSRRQRPLIRLSPRQEPARIFSIEVTDDGRLHILRRHGSDVSHLSVGLGREPNVGTLRLSYHWDEHRRSSLLTAENLTKGTIRQQEGAHALPLLPEEISALFEPTKGSLIHPAIDWIGLSDQWQTVGPTPGLAPDTLVDTTRGAVPVAEIRPGDLVLTADHGPLPVLWQGKVSLPTLGHFRPVRILAPYFGLEEDMVLLPGQRIALSGAEVEYQFGEEEVLIEARHLANGQTAIWEPEAQIAPCHGLLFDRHALVRAGGIWTESLYLGRIARTTDLACATAPGALAESGRLPIHAAPVRRELKDYEALALMLSLLNANAVIAA